MAKSSLSLEERFFLRVSPEPNTGCWLWMGHCLPTPGKEYATMRNEKSKYVGAHRWAYEHFVGLVPDELQIDHKCEVKCCVNPKHLEPCTGLVNIRRRKERSGFHVPPKTHCPQGHEYTPGNTIKCGPKKQYYQCRICTVARAHAAYCRRKRKQRQLR